MSRLRKFLQSSSCINSIQGTIMDAMDVVFPESEYAHLEATILAPGYDGWESRAIALLKMSTNEKWSELKTQIEEIGVRYRQAVPYPNQPAEYRIDPLTNPHVRSYFCTRCGYKQVSLALSGICCHGLPKCRRCSFELHEPSCRRRKNAKPKARI